MLQNMHFVFGEMRSLKNKGNGHWQEVMTSTDGHQRRPPFRTKACSGDRASACSKKPPGERSIRQNHALTAFMSSLSASRARNQSGPKGATAGFKREPGLASEKCFLCQASIFPARNRCVGLSTIFCHSCRSAKYDLVSWPRQGCVLRLRHVASIFFCGVTRSTGSN